MQTLIQTKFNFKIICGLLKNYFTVFLTLSTVLQTQIIGLQNKTFS